MNSSTLSCGSITNAEGSVSAEAAINSYRPIYNFEHGITALRAVELGPYTIRICESAHTRSDIFKANDASTFQTSLDANDNLVHAVTHVPARDGVWTVTAVVDDHPDLQARSRLFPHLPFMTGADDLALVLWCLTGREVAVGADKKPRLPLCAADRLVGGHYFYSPVIDWTALPKLTSTGVSDALHAVCLALVATDLLLKTSLGTCALDVLVSKWHSAMKLSRSNCFTRLHFKKATEAFRQSLSALGESPGVIDDIVARMPNLMNESAFAKLKDFLIHHNMLAATDTAALARVKLLNKHRNAIAHQAKILLDPQAAIDVEIQIAIAVSSVVLKICRVYVAKHLLGVREDDGVERDEDYIRDFFATGRLHGQDVFTESHSAYLARVEAAWVELGEFQD